MLSDFCVARASSRVVMMMMVIFNECGVKNDCVAGVEIPLENEDLIPALADMR